MELKTAIYILFILTFFSCSQKNTIEENKSETTVITENEIIKEGTIEIESRPDKEQNLSGFIPKGYVSQDKIYGDLNKHGLEDCIIIIKGTDKNNIIKDEYRGELDRNRRGIVVLFNKNGHYEFGVKNYDCFSSENEDGGVYFAPELSVEINKGNLNIHYGHGRYGYWSYTFRFQNSNFELIGYDRSENRGPVVNRVTSVNDLAIFDRTVS